MGVTTDIQDVFGNPAKVLVGDPTQASGAGLVDLSDVLRAEIQMATFRQATSNEVSQLLQAYGNIKWFDVNLTLFSAQASFLSALFPEVASPSGDQLTFAEDPAVLTLPTLIVVPLDQFGSAATSDYVWYFPRVVATDDPGAWIFKTEEGLESGEPFTVSLRAMRTTVDQTPTAIPAGQQLGFRGGKPAGWSFPAGY